MNHFGFMITRLALTGPDLEDAELLFRSGLNVITGPSDTGKTFAFECIDFMLGAGTPPNAIPEADGYDSVSLDIHVYQDNRDFSLSRSLKGGAFRIVAGDGEERVLGEKHKADDNNTLSQLLLGFSNLQGMHLRKNKKGGKRTFSFRDMAHLSVISEEKIIKKGSPLWMGQYANRTVEQSAYGLLLSGSDDSSITQATDTKEIKKRFEAKEEVIEELIANTTRKIEEMQIGADFPSLTDQLDRLEHSIDKLTDSLNETKVSAVAFEDARREAWARLKKVESRLDVLSELQSRFTLLHEQYQSDILRLQAISETGMRLGEMSLEYCPVCGASKDAQNRKQQECHTDPLTVAESCASEVSRVKGLIADLNLTQEDIVHEVDELNGAKDRAVEDLKKASRELQERLNPRINATINELRMRQERRENIRQAISIYEQLNEFEELLNGLRGETSDQAGKPVFAGLDRRYMETFAKSVQERLKAWKFPELDRVTFDPKDWDVVISGRSRSSHGKGVRAVTHAAFTLSLLRYCFDNNLPHSGIVVIDSPLVVYRQPDAGEEGFSEDVKAAFFHDISKCYQDAQVIIIENDDPPDDLASSGEANIIRFTGTSIGRRGFIPVPEQSGKGVSA